MDAKLLESAGDAVEKIGKSDRTLFVGIMLGVLVFLIIKGYMDNTSNSEARDAYLSSTERMSERMTQSLDKNTEVMIRIESRIK